MKLPVDKGGKSRYATIGAKIKNKYPSSMG